jgi:acetate---CoA ligase (ADP-forming) subunit alpha
MKNPLEYLGNILKVIVEEEVGDMILVYLLVVPNIAEQAMLELGIPKENIPAQLEKLHSGLAQNVVDQIERHGKPIIGYTFRGLDEGVVRHMIEKGIPVFPGHERAARALAAMVKYGRLRDKISAGAEQTYQNAN